VETAVSFQEKGSRGEEEEGEKEREGKRENGDERKEEKEGRTAGGKRMAGKGREVARISTIYTHVSGGTAAAVAVAAAAAAAISSIFRFSPFPGSLPSSTNGTPRSLPRPACLPTTPGETARRTLAVVLSDRA